MHALAMSGRLFKGKLSIVADAKRICKCGKRLLLVVFNGSVSEKCSHGQCKVNRVVT